MILTLEIKIIFRVNVGLMNVKVRSIYSSNNGRKPKEFTNSSITKCRWLLIGQEIVFLISMFTNFTTSHIIAKAVHFPTAKNSKTIRRLASIVNLKRA
jgi:hypothetical protein